jgi:hypothetical protein
VKYSYEESLAASAQVNWKIEDIIGPNKTLDFSRPFLPEGLARIEGLSFLNEDEKRVLSQIRGHAYLNIFGLVEEFILPFVLDHARPSLASDDYRTRALLQFAGEEAKHIQLFKIFAEEFRKGFGHECQIIGPPQAIAQEVLSHHPLGVALVILHIEWMTQRHFVEAITGDLEIDPQFKSLLRHHWMEEAQHAKLDTLMVEAIGDNCTPDEIEHGVDEYLAIGGFIDGGLRQQTEFDLEAFENATGRTLTAEEREEFIKVQHQSNRWTYLGTGMSHPEFLKTVGMLSETQRARLEQTAPAFC